MERIPEGPDRFRAFAFGERRTASRSIGQLTSVPGYVKIRGRSATSLVFGAFQNQFL
jgi:hypothetical protein